MVEYEIRQSENGLARAYSKFMDLLSEHVILLAKKGKPISSIMGIKRGLWRLRKQLSIDPSALRASPLEKGRSVRVSGEGLGLLVSSVMDKLDIDVSDVVKCGLVGEKGLKRVLIKFDYGEMAKQGIKYKDIKKQLSEKYGWSVSSIEKLVYTPRLRHSPE